jgi:hypothetical protein
VPKTARQRLLKEGLSPTSTRGKLTPPIAAEICSAGRTGLKVLKSGKPYEDLGADFYTQRESPEQRRAYLLRQLEKLSPGCTITITPAEAA